MGVKDDPNSVTSYLGRPIRNSGEPGMIDVNSRVGKSAHQVSIVGDGHRVVLC